MIVNHFGIKPARGGRPDSDRREIIRMVVVIGDFEKEIMRYLMEVVDILSSVNSVAEMVVE